MTAALLCCYFCSAITAEICRSVQMHTQWQCLLPAGLRGAHPAGIKFTHRSKISFFAPLERLVEPIHVKLGTADRHVGLLGCTKFNLNRCRGWESGLQISKISVNDRPRAFYKMLIVRWFPWSISKSCRGFYAPNYPALVVYIWLDSLHCLRVYCWETARLSFRSNFSEHPVGKTIRWIGKWLAPFWWSRRALSPCKVWGSYNACWL